MALEEKIKTYSQGKRKSCEEKNLFTLHDAVLENNTIVHLFYEASFWEGGNLDKPGYRYKQLCYTCALKRPPSSTDIVSLSNVGKIHFESILKDTAKKLFKL